MRSPSSESQFPRLSWGVIFTLTAGCLLVHQLLMHTQIHRSDSCPTANNTEGVGG